MDVTDLVTRHYAGLGLADVVLGAPAERGIDVEALTVDDLAPVDQLHAGSLPATVHLLEALAPARGLRTAPRSRPRSSSAPSSASGSATTSPRPRPGCCVRSR
jgi:hypothetical protein